MARRGGLGISTSPATSAGTAPPDGIPVRILVRPEWDFGAAVRDDVAIHVLGASEATLRPGQVNVLWHLSHPDVATPS